MSEDDYLAPDGTRMPKGIERTKVGLQLMIGGISPTTARLSAFGS